jgi:Ni/Fe-hydrogenase b-type cytochrome subunit
MTATEAVPARQAAPPEITVAGAYTAGKLSAGRVLALARAAAPAGSDDPVDLAVARELAADRPDLAVVPVAEEDLDPATPERRYAVALVSDFPLKEGQTSDLVVMRGQLDAVLNKVKISRKDKSLVRRNADYVAGRGYRPLAVATALVGPGNQVGDFRLQGFVNVGLAGHTRGLKGGGASDWTYVNVWSLSLRFQHWINVATIFTLSITGYFIMHPFYGPEAHGGGGEQSQFLMGYVRLLHFAAAALWVVLGVTRVVSAFVARDPHLRWTEWWPLKRKRDVQNLGQIVQHYALIKEEAPLYLAHNPLQQLTYAALYCACGIQMISGFSLFALYHQTNPIWNLVATPVHIFGTPAIRLFHTGMMFALWMFVIMHVYLAVRADSLDRHGGISSMINGGVWLRRGAQPVDAPEVG